MYGWCCKCREKRPEEYKKLVGWEILFFPFSFYKYSIETIWKCFQIGTSAHIVVGQSRTTTRWERCVSRSFFFPSASSRAVFWRWVIVNLCLPCLVLMWKLALSCLVLPCLASSCLVLPCLGVRSNNRPTMQERQCVKCNRSSVWRGDHDCKLKKQTNKGRQIYSNGHI